jgi:hypothetical protein
MHNAPDTGSVVAPSRHTLQNSGWFKTGSVSSYCPLCSSRLTIELLLGKLSKLLVGVIFLFQCLM